MKTPPKKGLDVIIGLGGGKTPPSDEGKSDNPMDAKSESAMPPEFEAAFRDYQKDPSPETFWEAIKSCVDSYGKSPSGD